MPKKKPRHHYNKQRRSAPPLVMNMERMAQAFPYSLFGTIGTMVMDAMGVSMADVLKFANKAKEETTPNHENPPP